MLDKLKILDKALDKLDIINKDKFSSEKFRDVNLEIEMILLDIKSNYLNNEEIKHSEEHLIIFENLLNKIDKLETKILPKANLLDTFSSSIR